MWNQVDMDSITFGNPKTLDNGGKIIGLYHHGKNLVFQTPPMTAPYGISKWSNDNGMDKFSLDLSINNSEFLGMMKAFDARIIKEGLGNSQNWFKKTYGSADILEALYTKIVKYSRNEEAASKYPPVLNCKMPQKQGEFECEVYDKDKNRVPVMSSVQNKSLVTAILQCTGIWVVGGKFGCTFKVIQMLVVPPNSITGYAFQDDADDEEM